MKEDLNRIPDFDDIVFSIRNKNYGGYTLRKQYKRTVIISLLIGIIIMVLLVFGQFINASSKKNIQHHSERLVEIKLGNLDPPVESVAPPPPPPSTYAFQKVKYVPPVVVDSVNLNDNMTLMTADQASTVTQNVDPIKVENLPKEEVQEHDTVTEPFMSVEEMPVPDGGETGLLRFISENTIYPEIAKENNIQGKVYVRFCVTSNGNIDRISIFKGVDPALDSEAIRVVSLLPRFKPGKQSGVAVPVWCIVYVNFSLK